MMQIYIISSSNYQHSQLMPCPTTDGITHRGNGNEEILGAQLAKLRLDENLGRNKDDGNEVQRDSDAKYNRGTGRWDSHGDGSARVEVEEHGVWYGM